MQRRRTSRSSVPTAAKASASGHRKYFDSPRGIYGHVTAGESVMEAASNALDWFTAPHWTGPRPLPSTMPDISLGGDERRWHVPARRVIEWGEYRVA
jgi:hypothetical protein